ncbi:hypothetical protein IV55_GL000626 [Furfurilactobacillus siliginis]|nr:hypothetical protein IV55_GL000626 [Furfurilactobacillus siliginis]
MSPGDAIHTWSSESNFEGKHWVPELPLLYSGKKYAIKLNFTAEPADSVHTRLSFFDEKHELISSTVFKEKSGTFTYPRAARSYEISLVNMNSKNLMFLQLTLGLAAIFPRFKEMTDELIDLHMMQAETTTATNDWSLKVVDKGASDVISNMYYGVNTTTIGVLGVTIAKVKTLTDVETKRLAEKVSLQIRDLLGQNCHRCTLSVTESVVQTVPSFVQALQVQLQKVGKRA